MAIKVGLNKAYRTSEDVVARDVHGEFIIIPIASGIAGDGEEIFSLNEYGRAIWTRLDGKKTLRDVGQEILEEYDVSPDRLDRDITGIVKILLEKKMLVPA